MPRFGVAFALVSLLPSLAFPQQVRRDDLKPGLLFTVSEEKGAGITRIEPTVALTLNPGEAPHPQSPGGTAFTWTGYIQVITAGKYTFDTELLGDLSVTLGEQVVLTGKQPGETAAKLLGKEVELTPGIQKFTAKLTRLDKAIRVGLHWTGPGFRREPIPYFFFGHTLAQRPATFLDEVKKEHGRFLFEELSCIKCHKPEATDAMAKGLANRGGPNLSEIGKRSNPGWLDAWLKDPKKHRPLTTMPRMFHDDEISNSQRYAVVAYLSSLGSPPSEPKSPAIKEMQASVERGGKLYLTAGCAACHGETLTQPPKKKKKDDEDDSEPLKPEDSLYGLGTKNGGQSYYTLGAVGSKWRADGLAKFLENPLNTNPHGRMPNMMLTPADATDLARFLCREVDHRLSKEMPAAPKGLDPTGLVDPETGKKIAGLKEPERWKKAGEWLMTSKGCVNCHVVAPGGKALPENTHPLKLASIRKLSDKGCLAEKPMPDHHNVADYALEPEQRAALQTFLKDGLDGPGSPSPIHSAKTSMKRFNCMNCHNRDGEGGIDLDLAAKMKLQEKAENADDVQPPRLTGVGHKMRTSWMSEVILNAGRARPWMTLRMPQYGKENVGHLPTALPLLDGTTTDDAIAPAKFTKEIVEAGRLLTGKNGHGCISCHDMSGQNGGGTRGPDLATTNKRVRYDWYARWLHQPQRMAPGTKMPQVFLDGQALLKTVFGGDGEKQTEALWAYFSLGPGLPMPFGMEPPKGIVLSAKDRPEILRTFIPDGAGTKGIAVAYPGGLNLVFDTQTNRLAYAWSGNFLDASPVWNARGGKPATVLGGKFWMAPVGNPWGLTESREPPDFEKRKDDPAYGAPMPDGKVYLGPMAVQFEGYTLDKNDVPTFRYSLTPDEGKTKIAISETPVPVTVTVANGLMRKFSVETPAQKTAWFQAGTSLKEPRVIGEKGEKLKPFDNPTGELPAAGTKVILPQDGDKVFILLGNDVPAGSAWRFVKTAKGTYSVMLRLPESAMATKSVFAFTVWALPKDDEQLIQGLK